MPNALSAPPLDGWLVLDKPSGLSSAQAVARVRRLLGSPKAGHGGTLDPLATGVLPIALGEATKTMSFVMNGAKTYRFTVSWGSETSTDDLEGSVTATSEQRPSRQAILDLLPAFTGAVEQVPPAFSAIKISGARSYALARQGKDIELSPRTVYIDALTLLSAASGQAIFELRCGKGTYVRALARDIGRRLGCFGHVAALRRLKAGPFTEADMISLAMLEEFGHNSPGRKAVLKALRPLRTALDDIPALALSAAEAGRLKRGQPVRLRSADAHPEHKPVLALEGDKPVALAEVKDGFLLPRRVFNL
jgi:tRNA pseudouridine55 synthase